MQFRIQLGGTIRVGLAACALLGLSGCLSPNHNRLTPRVPSERFGQLLLPAPSRVRTAAGLPGPNYWQQQVDYKIDATLDSEARRVSATARITYTNNSPDPLDVLWLHLEQNLYKPDSVGARTKPDGARFDFKPFDEAGYQITSVTHDGEDIPLHVYDVLGRIDPPEPIAPDGGTFVFEIAWSFVIPRDGTDRMGWEKLEQGTVYELAQWFPAACVYDDVHGWNTTPFLGEGEFYTNYGSFDVRITVPRDHLVGATGVLQNAGEVLSADQIARLETARNSEETVVIRGADEVGESDSRPAGEGPLTWHFTAHDARTFAWASSAAFIWDAAGISERGTTPIERGGAASEIPPGTLVQSLYPKEALPAWSHSTEMLRFAIEGYSKRWFAYPYPVATNISGRASGMEYPMLIFCRQRKNEKRLYGLIAHEIGHTWFPMIVNTDERRHAWMDEGFNSFINIYSERERYPDTHKQAGRTTGVTRVMAAGALEPIETMPDRMRVGSLGMLGYRKPAVGLYLLREQILGPERFDAAFRRYIRAWSFKSPQPADFFRGMESGAGVDLAWFWRGWFLSGAALDQAVADVDQDGTMVRVTIENRGRLVMPVVYRVGYSNGSSETRRLPVEVWTRSDSWTDAWDVGDLRVVRVTLDPDKVFPDINRKNNHWR